MIRNEVMIIEERNRYKIQSVLASPRNSILYQVTDGTQSFVLKTSRFSSAEEEEAFRDEYETIKKIIHPGIPRYYAYYPALELSDLSAPVPAILMEYVEGTPLSAIQHLTTDKLKKYILDLGDALLTLLYNGVLYMDLHPGNLIIHDDRIRLIDYTKAYYYLTNPNPSYMPKISYQINQLLPGQQILIQAVTFLIVRLQEQFSIQTVPSSLIQLGEHPHSGVSFSEFLAMLDREWETD